jgi:hypothetical protein
MRRLGAAIAAAGRRTAFVVIVLAPALATGIAGAETVTRPLITWRAYAPRWEALSVAPGERAVVLGVTENSCGSRHLRIEVHESRYTVRFAVRAEAAVYGGPGVISCPGPHERAHALALRSRLGGRAILGARPDGYFTVQGIMRGGKDVWGNTVPRLIGFAPLDARQALSALSLHAHIRSGRGRGLARVVSQYPRAGTFLAVDGLVRLRAAR